MHIASFSQSSSKSKAPHSYKELLPKSTARGQYHCIMTAIEVAHLFYDVYKLLHSNGRPRAGLLVTFVVLSFCSISNLLSPQRKLCLSCAVKATGAMLMHLCAVIYNALITFQAHFLLDRLHDLHYLSQLVHLFDLRLVHMFVRVVHVLLDNWSLYTGLARSELSGCDLKMIE